MWKIFLLAWLACAAASFAASPTIRVDFDKSGRQSSEVSEDNYIPWVVTDVTSADTTISDVTITVAEANGTAIATNWYKASVQSPYYAKLVGDGIYVEDGNSGGELSLTFSGLEAGTHTLLAYLNNVDSPEAYTYSDVDVYVNGTKTLSVTPTNRALSTSEAASVYVSFTVASGGSAVIRFVPTTTSATFMNVTLNGFALNVEDASLQAHDPAPADLDDHAEASDGLVALSWTAGETAALHRVYFGTDSTEVLEATTSSSAYMGEQADTLYEASAGSVLSDYFWRVDEVDASGTVITGDVWRFRIGRVAFEGAEGYGRMARGGRGGSVVYVTNLDDSGEGSLRDAIENYSGPRTIVFKVGGVIELESRLALSDSYVTIAGQTAPGTGITIKAAPFGFSGGSDNIMRFVRVRVGAGTTYDGSGMAGSDYSIMDHCSISWTIDEGFSSRNAKNVTLQRSMITEALNIAGHENYAEGTAHGYAATISGDVGSFHHNLLVHNEGRNWSLGGGLDGDGNYAGRLDIFNNVVYNWGGRATDGGAHEVNFVGNYYKIGPATTLTDYILKAQLEGTGGGSQAYYYHNNILESASGSLVCDGTDDDCSRMYEVADTQVLDWEVWNEEPFFESYATIQTASAAYKDVLSDVGTRLPVFDPHDERIVSETLNGTYTYVGSVGGRAGIIDDNADVVEGDYSDYPSVSWADDYDTDLDGLPDWWEEMYGYSTTSSGFADANTDREGDGYTELERFLEWMAHPHYKIEDGETQEIDLSEFAAGYSDASYSLSSVPSGVNASLSGSTLTVSLSDSFGGVAYLAFVVSDSDGDTFERSLGVRGTNAYAASADSTAIFKCGGGSSSQSVADGDSIVSFCYTWINAETVEVSGLPSSLSVVVDDDAQKVTISGVAEGVGEYPFTVTAVNPVYNDYQKSGKIVVTGTDALAELQGGQLFVRYLNDVAYLEGLPQGARLVVTDLSGRHLMARKQVAGTSALLDFKAFGSGTYLIHVRGRGVSGSFKVQKR